VTLAGRGFGPAPIGGLVKFSYAVMAHPKRAEWAEQIAAALDAPIVWDRINDRHDTGYRAIEAYDPSADYHVVIQDDAVLAGDWHNRMQKVFARIPEGVPVGLYFGNGKRHINRYLRMEHSSYVEMDGPVWGPAIAFPVGSIPDLLAFYASSTVENYDRRVMRFYQSERVRCWYPIPSMVDHRIEDNPSLSGHDKPNRRAYRFAGPRADASVGWFGPVFRA